MDIGIIGCGTAGGASALLLSRAGHQVTIYERVFDPLPVGAGIVLQPTGLSTLAKLGLFERVVSRGARIDRLHAETSRGRTIVDLHYAEVQAGLYGLGIHRGALFEALFDEVKLQVAAGTIALKLGQPIAKLVRENSQRRCVAPDGTKFGPHDLIIVADGSRSQLREGQQTRSMDYRYGALWFVARDPERQFHTVLHQVVEGTSAMLGLLPTGLGPGHGTEPVASLYWSVREDRVDHLRGDGFEAWKRRVLSLNPSADRVLAQIERGDQLLFSSYKHVTMPRWHQPGVVYLGDAGHAMSPQLGQGANLALYDALILSECLEVEAKDLSRALELYSTTRRSHLRFYQFATRWLTPFFQSDSEWLGVLRDIGMAIMTRIKPFRMEMSRSMIGIKRGIVRKSLPLPQLPQLNQ